MMREEYPRPQFVREQFVNLNGVWSFAFDDKNIGIKERWYCTPEKLDQTIEVPLFINQS